MTTDFGEGGSLLITVPLCLLCSLSSALSTFVWPLSEHYKLSWKKAEEYNKVTNRNEGGNKTTILKHAETKSYAKLLLINCQIVFQTSLQNAATSEQTVSRAHHHKQQALPQIATVLCHTKSCKDPSGNHHLTIFLENAPCVQNRWLSNSPTQCLSRLKSETYFNVQPCLASSAQIEYDWRCHKTT